MVLNISEFRRLRGVTLSSQIVGYIRAAIFAGELTPGDVLGSEPELAKQFDVSRMSIRDSLRTLEAMGLVEIKIGAKGGATIAHGNSNRLVDSMAVQMVLLGVTREQLLQARAAIESMTATLAAKRATDDDLHKIRLLLEEAEAKLDDPKESARLGEAFHLAVAEAAGNAVLTLQLKAVSDALANPNHLPDRNRAQHILDVHQSLFELIAARDEQGARENMMDHVERWIN